MQFQRSIQFTHENVHPETGQNILFPQHLTYPLSIASFILIYNLKYWRKLRNNNSQYSSILEYLLRHGPLNGHLQYHFYYFFWPPRIYFSHLFSLEVNKMWRYNPL